MEIVFYSSCVEIAGVLIERHEMFCGEDRFQSPHGGVGSPGHFQTARCREQKSNLRSGNR